MTASIRHARPEDASTVYELIVALAAYEKEPDIVQATATSLAEQMSMEPPPFECLLLEAEGRVCGLALFFHNYSTWRGQRGLYLEDLFVVPEARGRGFGFALLQRLAQLALERDCARMEWAVLDWNQPAIEFYRRLGAEPLHEWLIHRLCGEALARLGRAPEANEHP